MFPTAFLLLSIFAVGHLWEYDDDVIRSQFYPLAAASWSWEDDLGCLLLAFPDVENYKRYEVDVGDTVCYAVVGTSEEDEVIAISFRGTNGMKQFWAELESAVLPTERFLNTSAHVSRYFDAAFSKLWEEMRPQVQQLIATNPQYEIWVTGHSMGGSLASLAAVWISMQRVVAPYKLKLVTFAEPRTGFKDFADLVQTTVPNRFRVIKRADPVPHLPPADRGYYHFDNTIAYDRQMESNGWKRACDDSDSLLKQTLDGCLVFVPPWEWAETHQVYFGRHISDWGNDGCEE